MIKYLRRIRKEILETPKGKLIRALRDFPHLALLGRKNRQFWSPEVTTWTGYGTPAYSRDGKENEDISSSGNTCPFNQTYKDIFLPLGKIFVGFFNARRYTVPGHAFGRVACIWNGVSYGAFADVWQLG
ncbi:unnamed protein product [Allacma fusca]|uniref:Uncharacterized protein n=1 Tax=Allacma fusca TaxID=39272 RepID=A0A8J2P1H9_9HEXA|nr:unnamed protein product [Allacma fusca]